ncbi:Cof-type HAD-IIB family hydrolase [Haloplasma contractile]|uniref:Hydrolase haloacid dehalogenase-like family protein n=1 Tax=Haloplasma contractile SSD-17B TaxID=1033810 RepID=U2EEV7_9MOLU|nr:Cof-type HAD-IIB family hydrolase [Haloplasma contractile]ERJ13483.1 Hydrolase haloacid dehalogenase-like family protein [Haloplasma contractile SSD-17B]
MEKKIVFIDIDGTLFDHEHNRVHQSTVEAINKLRENDIYVFVASGRSRIMALQVLDRYDIKVDGYVFINGQYVIYKDEVIYKNPISKEFLQKFITECEQVGEDYGFMTEHDYTVSSHSDRVVESFVNFKMKIPDINKEIFKTDDVFQGLIFDLKNIDYFNDKYKDYVKFIPWLGKGADIVPKNGSKANGISYVLKKLGAKRENVYAIGDSYNDIEMIKFANYGIAMGNANDTLKKVADYVTDDITKDGLYKAMKHYKLI